MRRLLPLLASLALVALTPTAAIRRVRAGRYTLVVTLGRTMTVRVPMRIG